MSYRLLFPLLLLFAGCADEPASGPGTGEADTALVPSPDAEIQVAETPLAMQDTTGLATADAVAFLQPTEGHNVRGRILFTRTDEGVYVVGELGGLEPGTHGIHVHENGDCSAPDASSAGGHYNPTDAPHGAPDAPADARHVGDLGNLEAAADGSAHYERTDSILELEGPNSIVGRAVVVHAGEDDFTSQPSGDSGGRLACGVIEQTQ